MKLDSHAPRTAQLTQAMTMALPSFAIVCHGFLATTLQFCHTQMIAHDADGYKCILSLVHSTDFNGAGGYVGRENAYSRPTAQFLMQSKR